MINRTNTVLAVLLVVVVVMTAAVGVDYSKPNIEILSDMKYTPAWEAFAANPNFPDGRTMQPPVPGTIARGQLPIYYTATKEDAARAGEELENPVSRPAIEAAVEAESPATEAPATESIVEASEVAPATDAATATTEVPPPNEAVLRAAMVNARFSASLERGGNVYRTFCISCHGPQGAGDGLVPQRGFPPPPSMLTGKSLQMKDGQLFHILTYGQGSMAPFAAQLSRELRWDVINFVRDLQSKAPPVPEEPAAEAEAASSAASNEVAPPAQAASAEVPAKPVAEPIPDTPAKPANDPENTSAKKPTEATEKPASATPPNELRESPAGEEKSAKDAESQPPGDEPQPSPEAESQ